MSTSGYDMTEVQDEFLSSDSDDDDDGGVMEIDDESSERSDSEVGISMAGNN